MADEGESEGTIAYRPSSAFISTADATGTGTEDDDDEESKSDMEVQESEEDQLQQAEANAALADRDAVDSMDIQREGEESAIIDQDAQMEKEEASVIEGAADLQQVTTGLAKSFGIHMSDMKTLDPGQCLMGWDPAKSLVPGVIINGPQMVDNLVKWLQEGHADQGVTGIKEETFGEEVTPLTPEQEKGINRACKESTKVHVAGKEFQHKHVKHIPILRMGTNLRVVECSRDVNKVLSYNVNYAKASLAARKHFGAELYDASKRGRPCFSYPAGEA